jgi:hypothetical protein
MSLSGRNVSLLVVRPWLCIVTTSPTLKFLHGSRILEDSGEIFIRKVGNILHRGPMSRTGIPEFSITPKGKYKFSRVTAYFFFTARLAASGFESREFSSIALI